MLRSSFTKGVPYGNFSLARWQPRSVGCRQALASSLAWADRAHSRSAPKLPALRVVLVPIGRDGAFYQINISTFTMRSKTLPMARPMWRSLQRGVPARGRFSSTEPASQAQKPVNAHVRSIIQVCRLPILILPSGQLLQGLRKANCKGPSYGDLHLSVVVLALGQAGEG